MNLDLPTLMVMQSFALACAGAVLLVAWLQNQKIRGLALWGIAHIIAAGGILSLMLGFTSHQPAWLALGGLFCRHVQHLLRFNPSRRCTGNCELVRLYLF